MPVKFSCEINVSIIVSKLDTTSDELLTISGLGQKEIPLVISVVSLMSYRNMLN